MELEIELKRQSNTYARGIFSNPSLIQRVSCFSTLGEREIPCQFIRGCKERKVHTIVKRRFPREYNSKTYFIFGSFDTR